MIPLTPFYDYDKDDDFDNTVIMDLQKRLPHFL